MPSSAPDAPLESALEGLREHERQLSGLARYDLRESLGEGATSVVCRAWDRELRRDVALKMLRAGLGPALRERFRREAQALAGVVHPNVLAVYDAGERDGVPYLVLELVRGRPLDLHDPARDPRKRVALLERAARGVAAAHEKGFVHRDLKPENLLVTDSGEVKVADFGLAVAADSADRLTQPGARVGTPLYMAPEQVDPAARPITPRTDVYALGAILYEALTGRPPHRAETLAQLFRKILEEDPPRDPAIPPALEGVVFKALARDPAERYPTAAEFAEDLRRFLDGREVRARAPRPAARRLARLARSPLAWLVALALAAGLAGLDRARRLEEARAKALRALRERARLALDAALELRRAGATEGMRRLLPELEAAYREVSGLAEAEYLLGRMYRALMEDARALELQERALALDPSLAPARYERAVLLSRSYAAERHRLMEANAPTGADDPEGRAPGLRALRERVLRDCEALERASEGVGQARALAARGILAFARDRAAEAEPLLRKAVALDPFLEEAWETLGLASRSEEVFAQALALDRGYAPTGSGGAAFAWSAPCARTRPPATRRRRSPTPRRTSRRPCACCRACTRPGARGPSPGSPARPLRRIGGGTLGPCWRPPRKTWDDPLKSNPTTSRPGPAEAPCGPRAPCTAPNAASRPKTTFGAPRPTSRKPSDSGRPLRRRCTGRPTCGSSRGSGGRGAARTRSQISPTPNGGSTRRSASTPAMRPPGRFADRCISAGACTGGPAAKTPRPTSRPRIGTSERRWSCVPAKPSPGPNGPSSSSSAPSTTPNGEGTPFRPSPRRNVTLRRRSA